MICTECSIFLTLATYTNLTHMELPSDKEGPYLLFSQSH